LGKFAYERKRETKENELRTTFGKHRKKTKTQKKNCPWRNKGKEDTLKEKEHCGGTRRGECRMSSPMGGRLHLGEPKTEGNCPLF